jgi:hypothetical protein
MVGSDVVITRTKRSGRLAVALITASTLLIIWTLWTSARDETLTDTETLQTLAVSLGLILFGIPALRAARRTRVSVTSHQVLVANGYYVNEFPVATAEVVITDEPVDEHTAHPARLPDDEVPTARRMFLQDGDRRVPVDASLGLVPKDFDKLAGDIKKAIADARGQIRTP